MAYQPAGGPSIDGRPELLSPRNLPAILNETFRVYGSDVWRFLALAAVVQVPLVALALMLGQLLGGLQFYMVGLVLPTFGAVLGFAAGVAAVGQHYVGRAVDVGDCYRRASWSLVSLLLLTAVTILALLLIQGPLLLEGRPALTGIAAVLVIPAVSAVVFISMSVQSVMTEGRRMWAAITRSATLIKGSWWRVFGIWVVVLLVIQGLAIVTDLPFVFFSQFLDIELSSGFGRSLAMVMSGLVRTVVLPVVFIAGTLLYYDLRVRKEDYSLTDLSRELGAAPA